jgi:hypothetical protein
MPSPSLRPDCKFDRTILLDFAKKIIKERPPFLFPEERGQREMTASEKTGATLFQAIMDKKGKHFARELEAAISAWDALFNKSSIKDSNGYKNQIISWLKANKPELSAKAIGRIATLVNPKWRGGSPKIGDK